MPIKIPLSLPAAEILEKENIFVMDTERADTQDIRPLKIGILNLMPTKIVTETQLMRLLSNTPLQIDITLLTTETYTARNTDKSHLDSFYKTFNEVKNVKFDGLIITGAPLEFMEFHEVSYWDELCEIIDWANKNVFSTLYVCWGAFAGLYHNHGIQKYPLSVKASGIFRHHSLIPEHPLLRGFDEYFDAPHSRFSYVSKQDIQNTSKLLILAESNEVGVYLAASHDMRQIYVTGHPEYDADTLKKEYERDLAKGINPVIPHNYFPDDNPQNTPKNTWRSHAHLLYSNWLNYCVYQTTPYNIEEIGR